VRERARAADEGTGRRSAHVATYCRCVSAPPRLGRVLALLALGLVLGGVCGAAGVWQWQRFNEKRFDNDELRAAAAAAPVPVDEVLAPGRPVDLRHRYRTVTATGRYDAAEQVLVRQRQVNDRVGFLVVTPLRTSSGSTLLVSRGFVPATGAATDTPPVPAPPDGEVRVTARVLPSETGGLGAGLPDRQVARIDVDALGQRLGARTYGGFGELIGSDPAQTGLTPLPPPDLGNPAGGAFTGQHLAYVVQWFLFAAFALAGPVLLLLLDRRARHRETSERPAEPAEPAAAG
jgi:cytochrome oxidase assembly protein ShyY1